MALEHFDRLFILFAAGVGLLLAGAFNLALGTRGHHVWLRAIGTVIGCSAVVVGLGMFTRPELAFRAAELLFGVLLLVTFFSSGWIVRQLSHVVAFFRKPAPRWTLVLFAGLAVIISAGVTFEKDDEAALDEAMHDLEIVMGHTPSRPVEGPEAVTDRGSRIVLKAPVEPREESELVGPEEKTLRGGQFHDQLIRKGAAADHSNCHGWVFTGGKYLLSPDDVEMIVKDNGYRETPAPRAGDLVVYRQAGAITHTAIVRYVTEGQPVLVEGKWGAMGVFLHPADKSYYGTEYAFYRSNRQGHLLVGLGGGAANPNAAVPTALE